jgi:hypothetical protein
MIRITQIKPGQWILQMATSPAAGSWINLSTDVYSSRNQAKRALDLELLSAEYI